jgi:hypothetical protein
MQILHLQLYGFDTQIVRIWYSKHLLRTYCFYVSNELVLFNNRSAVLQRAPFFADEFLVAGPSSGQGLSPEEALNNFPCHLRLSYSAGNRKQNKCYQE